MKLEKRQEIIAKIFLLLSWPTLGLFMTITKSGKYILLNSIIIFITILFLLIKKINIKSINKNNFIYATLIGIYTEKLFLKLFAKRISLIQKIIIKFTHIESIRFIFYPAVSLLILPTILFCIYLFIEKIVPKIKKEILTITKAEKKYLIIITIIGIILSIVLSLLTSAFQEPITDKLFQKYDVIYTSDNGYISKYDAWANLENSENDIRQPLFALFSMPFSIPCHMISELLFFIPGKTAYYTTMSIFQFIILAITNIMLSRLIGIKEEEKKYFYLFISSTFPYVLFSLVLEQYVVGLFYLVLTIYWFYTNVEKNNYIYMGAVGTMITSGVLLPFLVKTKSIKEWIKNAFYCLEIFIITTILSGQFAQVFTLKKTILKLSEFTGVEVTFINKIQQFTHFVKSIFISPNGIIQKNNFNTMSYQLIKINTISIIGIIIIVLCLISAILNRKNKMSIISLLWIIFSFAVLVVIGWGSIENGQILYSLYFSWAYYTLIYFLINKIKNRELFKYFIITLICITLFTTVGEMSNIIKFALTYYIR